MIQIRNEPAFLIETLISLSQKYGYHFRLDNMRDTLLRLRKTYNRCGYPSSEAFLEAFVMNKLSSSDTRYLIDELMNSESYFFRHRYQHNWVMTTILPDVVLTRSQTQTPVRIWHAGCSRGEEVYSTSLFLDGLYEGKQRTIIEIFGSDINTINLDQARQGLYRSWSLRDMPAHCLRTYYKALPEQWYELDESIRSRCQFSYCNLVDQHLPPPFCDQNSFDLIFCRNVFIYFTEQAIEQAMGHFYHALRPGGYLILSPSEGIDTRITWLERISSPTGFIYRKKMHSEQTDNVQKGISEWFNRDAPVNLALLEPYTVCKNERSVGHIASEDIGERTRDCENTTSPIEQSSENDILDRIEQCVIENDHIHLKKLCDELRVSDPENVAGYYYPALLCIEDGQFNEALDWLRKSLYLDNKFLVGLIQLAHVYQLLGKVHCYHKTMKKTQVILTKLDLDKAVPHANGRTARELLRIIDNGGFIS